MDRLVLSGGWELRENPSTQVLEKDPQMLIEEVQRGGRERVCAGDAQTRAFCSCRRRIPTGQEAQCGIAGSLQWTADAAASAGFMPAWDMSASFSDCDPCGSGGGSLPSPRLFWTARLAKRGDGLPDAASEPPSPSGRRENPGFGSRYRGREERRGC